MCRIKSLLRNNSGASAVEFAILAPVFIMVLLSIVAWGIYLSAAHSVQQVAADAARTAVAGLSRTERENLARDYVTRSALDYTFLNGRSFSVNVGDDPANPSQFTVTVTYDASNLPIWGLYTFAMPDKNIRRFSTIRIGGI